MSVNPQLLYLAQSDTTVGFLSQNKERLANSKNRDPNQPFIICTDTLSCLKKFARAPRKYKNLIRRSTKITFVYPNKKAIRVVKDSLHGAFLHKISWAYSSSANLTTKSFDLEFAQQKADIIVQDSRGLFEAAPSAIIRLGKHKKRRLR